MRVALLGPIEVDDAAGPVPVAGAKLQALLALLALAAPNPVSDDRLLEELWGDDQPAKPANALQAQVSHLRRILGRDRVTRHASGYTLAVPPEDIDVTRLERLVHDGGAAEAGGDHRRAVELLGEAVALVRGEPLAGLADHAFARHAAARIGQLLLDAHEALADAELATGRHVAVAGRMSELLVAHPLRERFHAQLILALYRSERQADALRAFQSAREVLVEELGIEPGPELRALERSVLAQDPALASPVPLSPGTRPRSTAPVPLTPVIGREGELVTVARAMSAGRLVTLIGPGGVGKTRIATEVVNRFGADEEAWFVELAPVIDPAEVSETVASVLAGADTAPTGGDDPVRAPDARSIDRIGDRSATVVIDNCEHVIDAAAACVRALLGGCPRLVVLATSREPLAVPGERQVAIGPLDDDDACDLFVERARAVQPSFGADDAGDDRARAELIELCRRLDGLPLAIELAAARTKTLPVPEISTRLDDRFHLLRTNQRGGESRHQGLGAAIDWSYELLFDDERHAFRQLAVFVGGANVDAVEATCGPDALELATRLIDRSLLVADTSGRQARFRMLESLRAYGMERLAEEGETQSAAAAHLRWCLDLAERVDREARGADQLDWLARLDAEHDNVRAALAHGLASDVATGMQLVGALIIPWWFRGRRREARQWVDAYLDAPGESSAASRARVLSWQTMLLDSRGRPGGVEREVFGSEVRVREALSLASTTDDESLLAYARVMLALTLVRRAMFGLRQGEGQELAELLASARRTFERPVDEYGLAMVSMFGIIDAVTKEDMARAKVLCDGAVARVRGNQERFLRGRLAWFEGALAEAAGDPVAAYRHVERGVRLLDELGMGPEVTSHGGLLARLAEANGEPELAARWKAFVSDRAGTWGHDDTVMALAGLNKQGLEARAAGDLDAARVADEKALVSYRTRKLTSATAFSESCLGFVLAELGEPEAAAAHHAAALEAAVVADDPSALALALEGAADGSDDPARVAELLGAARTLWSGSEGLARPTHRDDAGRIAARARAELGDEAFEALVARGAALDRPTALSLTGRLAPGSGDG